MQNSKIEWCDSTWNPVTGCLHKCEYCYARSIAKRFGSHTAAHTLYKCHPLKNGHALYELEKPAKRYSKSGKLVVAPYPCYFEPTLHRYRLDEPQLIKKPQTIFVCSMADLFGAWVPLRWIVEVLDACKAAPQHRYMFLTKNPTRYAELDKAALLIRADNLWYGTTITSKTDKRFKGSPSLNTFLSIEPLHENLDVGLGSFGSDRLIIIGAETGNRAGKITPKKAWVDNICEAADITRAAVFMKDSLIPVVGEDNMRRELPWKRDE